MNIQHIKQPTPNTCVATVAAMYLGVSLEECIKAMPDKKSGTRTRVFVEFIRKHGGICDDRMTSIRDGWWLPLVCVVRVRWKNNKGHFVLKNDRTWHDPLLDKPFTGEMPDNREWSNGGKVTAYLELYPEDDKWTRGKRTSAASAVVQAGSPR